MNVSDTELIKAAEEAMKKAYAPYSGFFVGAALVAEDENGKAAVFTGCNIENASFSPTICAERAAIADAVKNGYRHIRKIAVCGGKNGKITDFCPPCGVCRQVLAEFGASDTEIILWSVSETKTYTLEELLPLSFNLKK